MSSAGRASSDGEARIHQSNSRILPYVELYTDGACSPNPGNGGWGAVLVSPAHNHRREISGAEPDTTNNRMEITAIVEGLKALKRPCRVKVTTDSKYIFDAFTRGWLKKWKRTGWITGSKQPVKNQDLWVILDRLVASHQVQWQWVRGHAGHPENEQADQLAVQARQTLPPLKPVS